MGGPQPEREPVRPLGRGRVARAAHRRQARDGVLDPGRDDRRHRQGGEQDQHRGPDPEAEPAVGRERHLVVSRGHLSSRSWPNDGIRATSTTIWYETTKVEAAGRVTAAALAVSGEPVTTLSRWSAGR